LIQTGKAYSQSKSRRAVKKAMMDDVSYKASSSEAELE